MLVLKHMKKIALVLVLFAFLGGAQHVLALSSQEITIQRLQEQIRSLTQRINDLIAAKPTETAILLRVISPNGGESWVAGEKYEAVWSSTGFPAGQVVDIGLVDSSSGKIYGLVFGTPNDGKEEVTVPPDVYQTGYWLEISAKTGEKIISARSQETIRSATTAGRAFSASLGSNAAQNSVSSSLPKNEYVTLLVPNGGEIWVRGQSYDIKWSTNADKINLELFDGDNKDQTIATGLRGEDGAYAWQIPVTVIQRASYKVRASVASENGDYIVAYDDSDGRFVIGSSGSRFDTGRKMLANIFESIKKLFR